MKRWTLGLLSATVLLTGLGYLSSGISHRACEQKAAHDAVAGIQEDGVRVPYVYVLREPSPSSTGALRRAGFHVRPCEAKPDRFDCWPWAEVDHAETIGPYLVAVRSGFVAAPLAGKGTTTRYLCVFGLAFKLSEQDLWYT